MLEKHVPPFCDLYLVTESQNQTTSNDPSQQV